MASWQSGAEGRSKSKASMLAALAATGNAPKAAKLAGRNTLDYVGSDGRRRIRLHETDILTFDKKGKGFTIDTGGWNTPTTRERLNAYLPDCWRVGTDRGKLYLRQYGERGFVGPVVFHDTITVSASGKVKSDISPKAAATLDKQIDAFMKAWRKRGLPSAEESGGDPWIFVPGKVDASVMLDWIKSKYVHRHLYAMALRHAGLTEHGVALYHHEADRKGLDSTDYKRIRRYVRACVGLG